MYVSRSLAAGAAAISVLLCAACASDDASAGQSESGERETSGDADAAVVRPPVDLPEDVRQNLARPDDIQANVTWKPTTKVVENDRLRAILASPFSDDGVYVFDAGATEIASLAAGAVVVFAGVGIFRVLGVTPQDGALRVATESAPLDEAADDVVIRWDVATPKSSALVDYDPSSPSQVDGTSPQSFGTGGVSGVLGPRDFRGSLGGFDVSFGVGPSVADIDTYDFGIGAKALAGDTTGALSAIGWAARFRSHGEIIVHGGKFESAKIAVTDAIAEATVKMGMTKLSKKESIDLPPLMVIPFTYAGLPLFISVGASIDFEATGNSQTAILGTAKLGVRGDAAFTLTPGSGSQFESQLKDLKASFVGGEHVATIDVGLGTVVHFPKLSFGIGLPQLQDRVTPEVRALLNEQWKSVGLGPVAKLQHAVVASAYVKLATELVYNVAVDYESAGSFPVVKGTCAEVHMNGAIFYGGELELFGHKLSKEIALPGNLFDKQSAGRVGEPVKFGKTCK